jgi:hypothetical protein
MAMVGTMTVTFAGIGFMLNDLLESHLAHFGPVIRKDLPRAFTKKLEYLAAIEPQLARDEDRTELRRLRLELARLNEFRVNIVHGYLLKQHNDSMRWRVLIAKEEGAQLARRLVNYSNDDIQREVRAMAKASTDLSNLLYRLLDRPRPSR